MERHMNEEQKKKCHYIIHSHAAAAAAGNAIPVPGLGVATDLVTITAMTMSLCAVFGGSIQEEAAKAIAITTFKNAMLKQPIKVITKEVSKFIPFLGQAVAPTLSVVFIEAVGWSIAEELYQKFKSKYPEQAVLVTDPVATLGHEKETKKESGFSLAGVTKLITAATDFRKSAKDTEEVKVPVKNKEKAVKGEVLKPSGKTA